MNLKKIEKEFKKNFGYSWKDKNSYLKPKKSVDEVWQFIKQAIKQVVESVPAKEIKGRSVMLTKESQIYADGYDKGYDQKTKEILQWKKKILKELEEGK